MPLPLLPATELRGRAVHNAFGERLGRLEDLVLDLDGGCIAYAVLAFEGAGGGEDKRFAIPWQALRVDAARDELVVDLERAALENAPGFDKDHPPDLAGRDWSLASYPYSQPDSAEQK